MKRTNTSDIRWIVIHVWRGMPVDLRVYRTLRGARKREQVLRSQIDWHEDEVGLFEARWKGGKGELYPPLTPAPWA